MTPAALARLFLLFAGISLLLNASTVSYVQGGVTFSDAFSKSKMIAAFYGIFICGPLLIITLTICGLHARRAEGARWVDRLPLVWISDKEDGPQNRDAWETKAYLILTFALFVLAPVYGIGHMAMTVAKDGRIHLEDHFQVGSTKQSPVKPLNALPFVGSKWNESTLQAGAPPARLQLSDNPDDETAKTVDWLPYLTPLGLAAVLGGVLYAFLWCLWGLFGRRPPQTKTTRPPS